MSKKLLAAAIVAALAPAAVMAEASNVTIYGRIDYGFMSRGGDSGGLSQAGRTGRLNDFEDGILGTNRFGFKGSEDLGNGLKAIYEFEFGFSGDSGQSFGGTSNRHSWVGLTGAFGTALGGRVDGARYSFVGKYDPFKNQTVANAGSLFGVTSGLGQADRADNAVVYITPELAPGLKFLAAYTTSLLSEAGSGAIAGQDVETGDTPLYAIAAMYDNGPISLLLDYENLQIKRSGPGGSDLEFDLWVAGASYDFGLVKLSAYYESTEGDDTASKAVSNGDGWLIGLSAPVSPNITLKASYVQANDDRANDSDCSKWGIGGEYAFSKRTTAYATYAKINNDRLAVCGISKNAAGGNGTGSSGAGGTGYGDSGFNVGIAHTF
jgi:predicted porin